MAKGTVVNFEDFRAAREQRRQRVLQFIEEVPFLRAAQAGPLELKPRQRAHRFRMLGHLTKSRWTG